MKDDKLWANVDKQDLLSIIHRFSFRLYCLRKFTNKVKEAL